MKRRRPVRPQHKPVFIGCEGKSEYSYAALLGHLARQSSGFRIHVTAHTLQPGAGDPLELVLKADRIAREIERRRSTFMLKALLLDRGDAAKCAAAVENARKLGFGLLVWQDPDHEALLLRHLPKCQALRPPRGASMAALLREWPDYVKGMSRQQLSARIGLPEVRAAAAVEPDLQALLEKLGF